MIPTSVSKSSVNAARVTGGAIAKIGKNNLENKLVSFSRPNRLFKLFRRVTVIIGNELDNVRTGNNARKYRRKSTGQTFTDFKYGFQPEAFKSFSVSHKDTILYGRH